MDENLRMQRKWCEKETSQTKAKGRQCNIFSFQHDWVRSFQFCGQLTQVTFGLIPITVIQGLELEDGSYQCNNW